MGTNCNASYDAYPYANSPELYESWRALDFNLFRLPMAWQHVQIGLSGQLNETTMQLVDAGVQQITSNGSVAILDIVCIFKSRKSISLVLTANISCHSTTTLGGTARSLGSQQVHS